MNSVGCRSDCNDNHEAAQCSEIILMKPLRVHDSGEARQQGQLAEKIFSFGRDEQTCKRCLTMVRMESKIYLAQRDRKVRKCVFGPAAGL